LLCAEEGCGALEQLALPVGDLVEVDVGTITKGYSKVRSTDPKLQHPTDPKLLRRFTPGEHARIKGVPERLVDGVSATVAHQILGQGVVYPPFVGVGQHLGESLDAAAGRRPTRPSAAEVHEVARGPGLAGLQGSLARRTPRGRASWRRGPDARDAGAAAGAPAAARRDAMIGAARPRRPGSGRAAAAARPI
jgi:hypothetical protein